eukprot:GHRR01027851.1.p1 GENE.GHRR01027851.1~~GHRR01027851.1.p1  ORF type:complete len:124 (-),score=19.61 GHRR01027851.1:775-1146(-)
MLLYKLITSAVLPCPAVNRYYIFQVFATLIYQFLVGSALANLAAILANPGIIVGLLGVSAAQQANFFMTYIMINVSGLGSLSLQWWSPCCCATACVDIRRIWKLVFRKCDRWMLVHLRRLRVT